MMDRIAQLCELAVKRVLYFGWRKRCPVCGRHARRFKRGGAERRPGATCPFCGALERHRLLWRFLETRTRILTDPPARVLHVAPEPIFERKFRKLFGDGYRTADLFAPRVDLRMDICDIKLPDESFDLIFCSHVLEHVQDDQQAMRELCRVLDRSGTAFLLVPITAEQTREDPSITDPQERLRLFGQDDHVRRYGPDYVDRLEGAGFAVECYAVEDLASADEIAAMELNFPAAGKIFLCRRRVP